MIYCVSTKMAPFLPLLPTLAKVLPGWVASGFSIEYAKRPSWQALQVWQTQNTRTPWNSGKSFIVSTVT